MLTSGGIFNRPEFVWLFLPFQTRTLSLNRMSGVKVRVNVFDLSRTNSVTRNTKLAVYHTSVVIDEQIEVYFGFKAPGQCGIDTAETLDVLPPPMKGRFYETCNVGAAKRSFNYCQLVIERFKKDPRWSSDRYNIVYNNCHNFAWALCEALLGSGNLHQFPRYVFDCDQLTAKLYENFVCHFVNEKKPPYFLGKQPKSLGDDGLEEKKARNAQNHLWIEPELCKEIMAY